MNNLDALVSGKRHVSGQKNVSVWLFSILMLIIISSGSANGQNVITSWSETTPVPIGYGRCKATGYNGHIIAICLESASGVSTPRSFIGDVSPDGSIAEWRPILSPPAVSEGMDLIQTGEFIVVTNATWPGNTTSYVGHLDYSGSNVSWLAAPGIPDDGLVGGTAVASDGTHIFAVGGSRQWDPYWIPSVYVADFSGGVLSNWRTATPFPSPITWGQAIVISGYLYVVGGSNGSATEISDEVHRAPICSDGSLGEWESLENLLELHSSPGILRYNGTVHIIGGGVHAYINPTIESVLEQYLGITAAILRSEPMPFALQIPGTAVVGNYGYIVTGAREFGWTTSNKVWVAQLGPSDLIPPTTTASRNPLPNASSWNNSPVTISLNASDNEGGFGVKEIEFWLSGAQNSEPQIVPGSSATVTIIAQGTTTLTYRAIDYAGNVEEAKSLEIKIDSTPPIIFCSATPSEIWPPNNKAVAVKISVGLTDALSLPTAFTLVSVTGNSTDTAGFVPGTASTAGTVLAKKGNFYIFTYQGADAAGNTASCSTTVTVPHDQRK